MDIYSTNNYRKIWEHFNGPIPKDEQGRSYEIHHIDGNHSNNHIENLQCVSIQEHYDIHFKQKDHYACMKIGIKLGLSKEKISTFASEAGKASNKIRIENKTHHFLKENGWDEIIRKNAFKRVADGTHNFLDKQAAKNRALARVNDGTNPFLGGEIQGISSRKRVKEGSHNFITNNPHNSKVECPHCGKKIGLPLYNRWHGDNCKYRSTNS